MSAVVRRMGIFKISRAYDRCASSRSLSSLDSVLGVDSKDAAGGSDVCELMPAPVGVLLALTMPAFTSDSKRFVIPEILGTVLEFGATEVLGTCD